MQFKQCNIYLVFSLQATPAIVSVEGPGSTAWGVLAPANIIEQECSRLSKLPISLNRSLSKQRLFDDLRILAGVLVNIVLVSNGLSIMPVQNGAGQSATVRAEKICFRNTIGDLCCCF